MRATSIDDKHRLDISGFQNRQRFLSACQVEEKKVPTVTSVQEEYSSLIDDVLGSSSYVFITVNLTRTRIQRALDNEKKKAGGVLPDNFLHLGQEYFEAVRSGATTIEAMESLWNKFFIRLNQKVLGAKYKRYGNFLRWIRVYENETKRFSGEPANHLHMLVEVPETHFSGEYCELKQLRFKHQFRDLFSRLVYPLSSISPNNAVITISQARLTGSNAHDKYIMKQLMNWETAADRVFVSGTPKT